MSALPRRGAFAAAAVGAAGLIACAAGWALDAERFYRAWLWAFLFWAGLGVGSAGVLMIHHLVGGGWGVAIRRFLEAGAGTALLLPVLFLPVVAGLDGLYPWMREPIPEKSAYLNAPFFLLRAAVYFGAWILGAWLLRREPFSPGSRRRLSAAGLLVYAFTLSFASVDWALSLEPRWSSSIYGLLFISGQLLTTFAAAALAGAVLSRRPPFAAAFTPRRLHDLGNFLFMAVLLWAYVSFSQYLIIWSGNLPEEAAWYLRRTSGGWGGLALALAIAGFAVPFLLLLSEDVKRSPAALAAAASLVLLARLADTYWWVSPAFSPEPSLHWLDVAAPAGIGGVWLAAWFVLLGRAPEVAHA